MIPERYNASSNAIPSQSTLPKKEHLLLLMVSSQDGIYRMRRNGTENTEEVGIMAAMFSELLAVYIIDRVNYLNDQWVNYPTLD